MRTNIVIDDDLMKKAMTLSGANTKKATVDMALKLLVQIKQQQKARNWRGKLRWEGDLDRMRSNR